MAKSSGIYKIYFKNKPHLFYIGSAVNISERKIRHKYQLKAQTHKNRYLLHCYNKYGRENLVFEVIELCDKKILLRKEQCYISLLLPPLNCLKTAGSCLGFKHSQQSKQKISDANKGRKMTPEQITRGVLARKGQKTAKGCKWSRDAKKRLSDLKKKPIINYHTRQILPSIQELSLQSGIKYQTLYAQITARNNNTIGWRFL